MGSETFRDTPVANVVSVGLPEDVPYRLVGEVSRYATSEVFESGKDVPLVLDGRQIAVIPATDLLPEEMP